MSQGYTSNKSSLTGIQSCASFYDTTGGTTLTSGGSVTITLDTTQANNNTAVYSLASNEVTITDSGFYLITYEVTGELAAGTRSGMYCKLQKNTGGGHADVAGTLAYCYGRITTETMGTSSGSTILELNTGDIIKLVAGGTTQNFDSVADGSRLTFVQLKIS